jgi:hypothetical protein
VPHQPGHGGNGDTLLDQEISEGCSADIDGDGMVGIQDVLQILSDWGSSGSDVNGDGITNKLDLLVAISQMGDCPER